MDSLEEGSLVQFPDSEPTFLGRWVYGGVDLNTYQYMVLREGPPVLSAAKVEPFVYPFREECKVDYALLLSSLPRWLSLYRC